MTIVNLRHARTTDGPAIKELGCTQNDHRIPLINQPSHYLPVMNLFDQHIQQQQSYTNFLPGHSVAPVQFQPPPPQQHRQHRHHHRQAPKHPPPMPKRYFAPDPAQELRDSRAKVRALVAAVPEEILAIIYSYTLFHLLFYRRNGFAGVNQQWYRISKEPTAYNNLAIALPYNNDRGRRLDGLLSRASLRLPIYLDLTFYGQFDESIAPETEAWPLIRHSPRMIRLTFFLKGVHLTALSKLRRSAHHANFQNLEYFSMRNENASLISGETLQDEPHHFHGALAILRTATSMQRFDLWYHNSWKANLVPIIPYLANVRTMNLMSSFGCYGLNTEGVRMLLYTCRSLVTLTLAVRPDMVETVRPNAFSGQPVHVRENLRSLTLIISGEYTDKLLVGCVLDMLVVPNLTKLNISWSEPPQSLYKTMTVKSVASLIARSRCNLKRLMLTAVHTRHVDELFACRAAQLTLEQGTKGEQTVLDANSRKRLWDTSRMQFLPVYSSRVYQVYDYVPKQ